jgi:hypothetical protein
VGNVDVAFQNIEQEIEPLMKAKPRILVMSGAEEPTLRRN